MRLPENEHSHDDDEHEEGELLVAAAEGLGEGLEAGDVPAEAEDTEDAHDAEYLRDSAHLVLILPRALHVGQAQGDEVGDDAEQIDHVHPLLDEVPLLWRGYEPDDVLDGEPGDEDGLGDREVGMLRGLVCLLVSYLEVE